MFDADNRFVIRDYQQAPAFSSFLPGVAGPKGVPAWVYYNNRGQGVCSFGAKDKDHAIMEFRPRIPLTRTMPAPASAPLPG